MYILDKIPLLYLYNLSLLARAVRQTKTIAGDTEEELVLRALLCKQVNSSLSAHYPEMSVIKLYAPFMLNSKVSLILVLR